jgi:hypothetical protein
MQRAFAPRAERQSANIRIMSYAMVTRLDSPRTRSRPGSRKLPAERLIRRLVCGWLRAPWRCELLHSTFQFFIGLGGGDFAKGLKEPGFGADTVSSCFQSPVAQPTGEPPDLAV